MNDVEKIAALEKTFDRQAQAIKPFMDYCREELEIGERFLVETVSVVQDTASSGKWYEAKIRFRVLEAQETS